MRVPVASEGETRDEALGNAKEAIEASRKSRRNNSSSEPEERRSW